VKTLFLFIGLILVNAAAWNYCEANGRPERLGNIAAFSQLDRIVALGCGQNPSTVGNQNCNQGNQGCVTAGQIPNITCNPNGAECGGCNGVKNQTCQGQIFNNGYLCFEQNLNDCCSRTKTCFTQNGTWGQNPGTPGTNCACGNGGINYPAAGSRVFADPAQEFIECGVIE